FRTRTRDEWTEVFRELDACVEPVMSLEEVTRDPHLNARGMWPEVEVPISGSRNTRDGNAGAGAAGAGYAETVRITQMGNPLHLSECPPRYDHAGFPEGYHTEAVLAGLGYSASEIEEMI
ncbi:MAG: CoA transferase, partial [Stomatobaculum sp.]|nr:CoA transferase [Stomatobaculum sp.]